jgi:hypothetical protein
LIRLYIFSSAELRTLRPRGTRRGLQTLRLARRSCRRRRRAQFGPPSLSRRLRHVAGHRTRHRQLDGPARRDSRCHRTKRWGKATLIRLINGLEEPTEGRLVVDRTENHWWFRICHDRGAFLALPARGRWMTDFIGAALIVGLTAPGRMRGSSASSGSVPA